MSGAASTAAAGATASSSTSTGWWSSAFEAVVGGASEEAWDEGVVFRNKIVVCAVGEFGGDAGASVAFVEVAVVFDELEVFDEGTIVFAAWTVGAIAAF